MYYNINKRDKHHERDVNKMIQNRKAKEIRKNKKKGNIERYKKLAKMFENHPSMEISSMMSDLALVLVKSYGMTFEEVEALEY